MHLSGPAQKNVALLAVSVCMGGCSNVSGFVTKFILAYVNKFIYDFLFEALAILNNEISFFVVIWFMKYNFFVQKKYSAHIDANVLQAGIRAFFASPS